MVKLIQTSRALTRRNTRTTQTRIRYISKVLGISLTEASGCMGFVECVLIDDTVEAIITQCFTLPIFTTSKRLGSNCVFKS